MKDDLRDAITRVIVEHLSRTGRQIDLDRLRAAVDCCVEDVEASRNESPPIIRIGQGNYATDYHEEDLR